MRSLFAIALLFALGTTAFAQGTKVTLRADHTVLVDGKPFFPIGLYYCSEEFDDASGKLLKDLRGCGFNTLGFYRWGTPNWAKELDRAHAAGLKVWVSGENGFDLTTPAAEKAATTQLQSLRGHPALLFWEFGDEPLYNKASVEGSRKGHQLVKREDPHHPLFTIEWPNIPERFAEWRSLGDIFGTDLYPIPASKKYGKLPNHDITQIRDYIAQLRKAHGNVPVMLVLQAWAWDPLKDGEAGFPTVRQSRFMAYQAVVHGVSGLLYYGQVHCTNPKTAAILGSADTNPTKKPADFEKAKMLNDQFWQRSKPFFRELEESSAIFVLPTAKPERAATLVKQTPAGDAGIEYVTKQSNGNTFLIAVNADAKAREATFRLPAAANMVRVRYEVRNITLVNSIFTDKFEPYEVHVYELVASVLK